MEDKDEKLQKEPGDETGRALTRKERRELARENKRSQKDKEEKSKGLKKWVVAGVILIVLGFFGYKVWKWYSTPYEAPIALDVVDSDWVKGNAEAKITLIEYGDFECPACAAYASSVEQLTKDYPNDLRIVYRHYPLPQHKNAVPSAKAAEASGRQGKFWEMYDLLYKNQDAWANLSNPMDQFVEYAKSLGLNEDQFKSDYDSDEVDKSIKDDENSAIQLGIDATPTFYLNGKKLTNVRSYDDFKYDIDSVLNSQ